MKGLYFPFNIKLGPSPYLLQFSHNQLLDLHCQKAISGTNGLIRVGLLMRLPKVQSGMFYTLH